MGDSLVVSITSDVSVRKEKGRRRPVFSEEQRAAMLYEFRSVDAVLIVDDVLQAIREIRPNVFVKGIDYVGKIGDEVDALCKSIGAEIRFTRTEKFSATGLLSELRHA